jgi:SAM-dependent methyltransferase
VTSNHAFAAAREHLVAARERLLGLSWHPGEDYTGLAQDWLSLSEALKDVVFRGNPRNPNPDRTRFETHSAAQSMQFMIDMLPYIQRVLIQYYSCEDLVRLLDVGAGSGAGASLLAQLHASTMLHSRIEVDAIDVVPWREAWVATQHPRVKYHVRASSTLPIREWDLVTCSHVIEHLDNPREMVEDVVRACRGHAFFYAPYRESPLSAGHVSSIDESTFRGLGVSAETMVLDSIGWVGEGRQCILAVLDCRNWSQACY